MGVRFLGREDPLEEYMATHSSTLAWRIPMDRGAWGLQSIRLHRVGHDRSDLACTHAPLHLTSLASGQVGGCGRRVGVTEVHPCTLEILL